MQEDDLPVLSEVVKAGDENIIKSTRLENDDTIDVNQRIEQIIDKHLSALRSELRILLQQK